MLKADHQLVQGLFDKYEKTRSEDRKAALAGQICNELTVHTTIEEEIFYPAAREVLRDDDLLDEATVEHQGAKDLIAQIESGKPSDDLFDAKVKVLGEYIKHHVKEEHTEMFPQVRKTKLDLRELGERMQARKTGLKEGGAAGSCLKGSRRGQGAKTGGEGGKRSGEPQSEPSEDEGIIAKMARGIVLSGT